MDLAASLTNTNDNSSNRIVTTFTSFDLGSKGTQEKDMNDVINIYLNTLIWLNLNKDRGVKGVPTFKK